MFKLLQELPTQRRAWLLLALSALCLNLTALFFQYGLKLHPCVLCVYERTAMFGLLFAGLIGAVAPKTIVGRILGFAMWAASSIWGIMLSWEHTDIQLHPSPFNTCDFFASYPEWFKLDVWIPFLFQPSGDCADIDWIFLGWSMPQWLIVTFGLYLIVLIVVLISNLRKHK